MSCEFGEGQVEQSVIEAIRTEASGMSIARRHFGLWTERGLADTSCSLHSVGVSYWNAMGTISGFNAICEMPAPVAGFYGNVGDDVRNDSVWFPPNSTSPIVLVEFERYSGASDAAKLTGKADNLLMAHHRWQASAKVLILAYWTKSFAALPDHAAMRQRLRRGFETSAKERVGGAFGCELLFFQFVLQQAEESRWQLSQILERGVA